MRGVEDMRQAREGGEAREAANRIGSGGTDLKLRFALGRGCSRPAGLYFGGEEGRGRWR